MLLDFSAFSGFEVILTFVFILAFVVWLLKLFKKYLRASRVLRLLVPKV